MDIHLNLVKTYFSGFYDHVAEQLGKLGQHAVKLHSVISERLQDPRLACGAVVVSNIAFVNIGLKVYRLADSILKKLSLSDESLGDTGRIIKNLGLQGLLIGVIVGLNIAFAQGLNLPLSPQLITALGVATCVSYILARLTCS
ncbi:hypothetical protein [Candidatus Protochlamydia phocaeensis]|uniref:hypothetical protein n=1 Tax=Candidatus Protochlamydia phocaeensis TaxID=1414722 RepID=UPI00083883E0|nr:hypothetical protein [Candidatus Protochlamydia phocaeensis]